MTLNSARMVFLRLLLSSVLTSALAVSQASGANDRLEILNQVTRTCDGISELTAKGERAKIEVGENLEVYTKSDNSIEIRRHGTLLEKIDKYTANDRQLCIDRILNFLSGEVDGDNPLLKAARLGERGRDEFFGGIKYGFVGMDESRISRSGIPLLIFEFTNLHQQDISIFGTSHCNFNNHLFNMKNDKYKIHASAFMVTLGSNHLNLKPREYIKIAVEAFDLNPPAYQSEEKVISNCRFGAGFTDTSWSYQFDIEF